MMDKNRQELRICNL